MAGEYSRELSAKVFTGQCRLIELGYRQGGPAGLRASPQCLLISMARQGRAHSRGEHKSLQTDRVILVPGPGEEIDTVRRIYQYVHRGGKARARIAAQLNTEGGMRRISARSLDPGNGPPGADQRKIHRQQRLQPRFLQTEEKAGHNSPDMWIRAEGAFEPIVDRRCFDAAQAIIRERSRKLTNDEMIAALENFAGSRLSLWPDHR